MATAQELPPSQPAFDAQTPQNRNSTSNNPSRSLSDLARSKSSFKWTRPPPTFIATSSRGSIPHLTPDHIDLHTNILSVHIGLEDFITIPAHNSALLSIKSPLRQYLAYPENMSLVLGARRANPVPINSSSEDKIELHTIQGQTSLPVEVFINAIRQVQLREKDIVISLPDVTETPGVKRMTKMVERTQRWLKLLINSNPGCKVYASIPPIPPARGPALLDDYIDFLAENAVHLSGIAIYNIFPDHPITQFLPEEVAPLPIMLVASPLTPHEILAGILSDEVGVFTAGGMVTAMSDLGIALDFSLNMESKEKKIPLGRALFETENEDTMEPLVHGCQCYTCRKHYRAYIHHLLKCHEMTAWVLLQIHNFHVLDLFFKDIRHAIETNTFLTVAQNFDETYSTEDIIEAGTRGPRVRGHHTTLRREQKKRKYPVSSNKGVVGKDVSVLSGGEVIEREGKRKHWRQLEDGEDGITDEGIEIVDEEDQVEGELLPDGEVEMTNIEEEENRIN